MNNNNDNLYNKMVITIEAEGAGQLISCLNRIIKDIDLFAQGQKSFFFNERENIDRKHGRATYTWTITREDFRDESVIFTQKQ